MYEYTPPGLGLPGRRPAACRAGTQAAAPLLPSLPSDEFVGVPSRNADLAGFAQRIRDRRPHGRFCSSEWGEGQEERLQACDAFLTVTCPRTVSVGFAEALSQLSNNLPPPTHSWICVLVVNSTRTLHRCVCVHTTDNFKIIYKISDHGIIVFGGRLERPIRRRRPIFLKITAVYTCTIGGSQLPASKGRYFF
eukprot:SAG31_NODE_124_length_23684_cov_7.200127_11_plen_193_part_00